MEFAGDVVLQLMIAFRLLNGLVTDLLEAFDVHNTINYWWCCAGIGGAATQIELITYLKCNESAVRASIQVLKAKGFVIRNKAIETTGGHYILITDKARQLMNELDAVFTKVDKVEFRGLDQDEISTKDHK